LRKLRLCLAPTCKSERRAAARDAVVVKDILAAQLALLQDRDGLPAQLDDKGLLVLRGYYCLAKIRLSDRPPIRDLFFSFISSNPAWRHLALGLQGKKS